MDAALISAAHISIVNTLGLFLLVFVLGLHLYMHWRQGERLLQNQIVLAESVSRLVAELRDRPCLCPEAKA